MKKNGHSTPERKNGTVYTPEKLSQYVAKKLLEYALNDNLFRNLKKISVVDPASGDGILLKNVAENILQQKLLMGKKIIVVGTDIDQQAIIFCRKRLSLISNDRLNIELVNTNAFIPLKEYSLTKGWQGILKKVDVKKGFDLLIANPPWGADISEYKDKLNLSDFKTLQGQFDSFELFIELAIKIVKTGGYFGFIIPDSILNHGKSILRGILLKRTQICFIARLGEKIFPNVNRACVVIICKNTSPTEKNIVDCFRLSSKDRNKILNGMLTFTEAETTSAHKVPQERFIKNSYQRFDIDLKESETNILKKFKKFDKTLASVLSSTRGVELGRSGMICQCNNCSSWSPLSEQGKIICSSCGKEFNPTTAPKKSIISKDKIQLSVPFITGGNLRRYVGRPSLWIKLGVKGINYKPESTYKSPKILVRKTGVGITAILDYNDVYTNQVVYILKNIPEKEKNLEFFIGLINSRAYYFYLVKSFGELEWKSHPYLTQTQILSLPLPDMQSEKNKKIIQEIIELLRPILKKEIIPSNDVDIKVEILVGKLFSLNEKDYRIIFNAIEESDDLIPVMELKKITVSDIINKLKK